MIVTITVRTPEEAMTLLRASDYRAILEEIDARLRRVLKDFDVPDEIAEVLQGLRADAAEVLRLP